MLGFEKSLSVSTQPSWEDWRWR